MASKRYNTEKAPTNKIKGGLDAIVAGSIYATNSSRPKRVKLGKNAIQDKGGKTTVMNSWKKSGTAQLKHATVVKDTAPVVMQARIKGEVYVLGDRVTYSDAMLAELEAEPTVHLDKSKQVHKVNGKGSVGYTERHRVNGRRDTGRYIESLKVEPVVDNKQQFRDMQNMCCDVLESVYEITKADKPDTFQAERKALLSAAVTQLNKLGFFKLAEFMGTRKVHEDATQDGIDYQQSLIYKIKAD